MKKLLLVLFVASFVGLAFAYSPARIISSPELNGTVLMDDTTKTTKKATTKKDATKKMDCSKKSCCKKECSEKKSTPKKKDN